MTEIVDSPSEYWHSNSWGSSIHTCSTDLRDFPIHPLFSPLTLCSIAVAMINVGLFMTVTADRSYFLDVIKDRDL